MPKIQFNPADQQISVSGKIGRGGEATVKLDSEVQEVGINLGIIEVGATTDYGGAITLGIAGQSVTLGTQGGEINLGVGGFEVKVEARDCIVTEEKFIFGQLVASRSYLDPGCELDEPPTPPAPEPGPAPDGGLKIPQTTDKMWAITTQTAQFDSGHRDVLVSTISDRKKPTSRDILPFTIERTDKYGTRWRARVGTGARYTQKRLYYEGAYHNYISILMSQEYYYAPFNEWVPSSYAEELAYFGTGVEINNYFYDLQKWSEQPGSHPYVTETVTEIVPLVPRPSGPFLPTGNKPPMSECCEEILDILEDFKDAFDIERLLKDKFPVSNTFMAPECDPASVTEAKTYYEIIQCLFRMLAHGLIFEPRVAIKDADAAKAGDQEFKTRYLNATGWASAMAEAMLEVKDDGNVSTNMDIRNGFAATQTMVGVADALIRLDAILDCLGITLMPKVESIQTPYNCFVKIGKGFGEGNERKLDLNQDEATEKLLPDFLKTKINKIKTVEIHPRSESLLDILQRIESNLPPQSSG